MPTIKIVKTKIRRGSNAQRKQVVFDQAEPVYTTDTKRLYMGTGTTAGGLPVGNVVHPPLTNYYNLSEVIAERGDLVYVNNIFYQLTGYDSSSISDWGNVGTKVDPLVLSYNSSNQMTIATGSLSAKYLNPNTVQYGLSVISGILQVDYITKSFELSGNKFSMKAAGLDEREISSSSLGKGLSGGSGTKFYINADTNYFYFKGNTLSLSGSSPFSIPFSAMNPSWFGDGLYIKDEGSSLSSINVQVDYTTIMFNASGALSLNTGYVVPGTRSWAKVVVDAYGRVVTNASTITSVLTGKSTTNSGNSLSSIFNGRPSHTLAGAPVGVELTTFTATDTSGATVTLSSAGWLTFESGLSAQDGSIIGRFAIPIFAY